MKKFLLTLSLCFAAFTAMAQKQYTEKIVVTLNEHSFPEATSTLSVTTNDNGTCDFVCAQLPPAFARTRSRPYVCRYHRPQGCKDGEG